MQGDFFLALRRPPKTEPKTLADVVRQDSREEVVPADTRQTVDRAPPPHEFPPHGLKAGGGTCLRCGRPYVDVYFDTEHFVAENAGRFVHLPGEPASWAFEREKSRHKALLLQRGAEECPRHCGYALVLPPVTAGYRGLAQELVERDEDDAIAREKAEIAFTQAEMLIEREPGDDDDEDGEELAC